MKSLFVKASVISLAAPALVLLAAAGCGSSSSPPTPTPSTSTGGGQVIIRSAGTPTASAGATTSLPPRTGDFASLCKTSTEKQFTAAPTVIDPSRGYTATITTEKGDIVVQLDPKTAPVTVNSFVFLACSGFYDGVTFHRVIPGFVAQGGDPTGTGTGGPGYTIPDEFSSVPFDRGTVAMAKTSAPNSGGSQFFIDFAPQPNLTGNYTAFGKVTAGLDVLDKLTPRDPQQNPNAPPGDKILTITVQEQ